MLLWGRREGGHDDPAFKTPDWSPEKAARIEDAVAAWTDELGSRPSLEGRPFRTLTAWGDVPLWPLVRRFLRSSESASSQSVRLVESFSLVFETELPDEVEAFGLPADEVKLLQRCCTARGVLFQSEAKSRAARGLRPGPKAGFGLRDRMRALRSVFGGAPSRAVAAPALVVRPEGEADDTGAALERVLRVARDELTLEIMVAGGEDGFAPGDLLDPVARTAVDEAEAAFAKQLAALKGAPATVAAFSWENVGFADLAAETDLEALLLGLLPRAVRRAEGLRSILRGGRVKVLCATAGDALALAAARAEGVPALALEGAQDGPRLLHALAAAARGEGMVG